MHVHTQKDMLVLQPCVVAGHDKGCDDCEMSLVYDLLWEGSMQTDFEGIGRQTEE